MANKIKLDLQGMTTPDKIQFMRQVATKLTGNPNFPNFVPTPATINAAADTLQTDFNAQQGAQQTAKTATTTLGTSDDAADAVMNSCANNVEEASGGNTVKIESAGLSTRAPKTPTTSLPAPQNHTSSAGDEEGALDLMWDPVARSTRYEQQISDDPPTPTSWTHAGTSSASKTTLTELESGKKKWTRVRALGPKKVKSPWSDPALKRVP